MAGGLLVATLAVMATVPGRAAPEKPAAPSAAPAKAPAMNRQERQGKYLYGVYCSCCHGVKGDGASRAAETFVTPPSDFASGRASTDAELFHATRYGLKRRAMPSYPLLTDAQVHALVRYIRYLAAAKAAATASRQAPRSLAHRTVRPAAPDHDEDAAPDAAPVTE